MQNIIINYNVNYYGLKWSIAKVVNLNAVHLNHYKTIAFDVGNLKRKMFRNTYIMLASL
jgi:hypothetical protein